MNSENVSSGLRDAPEAAAFSWPSLHLRLDASRTALQRKLSPEKDEKQKILRARAAKLAFVPEAKTGDRSYFEVVEFALGNERYAIESIHIREIDPLHDFTPLPGAPPFVLGLANLRGQILSIINLKKLFDLPEKGLTDLNKVLVVHGHKMEMGILADAILGVRMLCSEDLNTSLPLLTGIRAEYLRGIAQDSLVVLDAVRILGDKKLAVNDD
ncbi:MAG TPA: chemotaxis protein CheW [Terriglobales bacterium]|jgi:purine-binding chemotaxis protein CheW